MIRKGFVGRENLDLAVIGSGKATNGALDFLGIRVVLKKKTPDGQGRVGQLLERNGGQLPCEMIFSKEARLNNLFPAV